MTERAEHERAADLVEVRVIGRRRPTLEREKAERECLEQRVLLLKAEHVAELSALLTSTLSAAFHFLDRLSRIVQILELPVDQLLSGVYFMSAASLLSRLSAYRHFFPFTLSKRIS